MRHSCTLPPCIENNTGIQQKLEYIHNNQVKRGFVDLAQHWRWSSARDGLNTDAHRYDL